MNILFISHLSGRISAGPCWSVPARIKAQAQIDNVYWVNWGDAYLEHWGETGVFHKSTELKCKGLASLPKPFDKPDYVVFEGFYSVDSARFAKELEKKGIPYIINPRGSLTTQARNNKSKLKKNIAHFLWFDRFIKQSSSIQYLTKQEKSDTFVKDHKCFVLPNGFNTPSRTKESFSDTQIKAIFIGRIDIYHKGLDLLIDACAPIANELKGANVKFDIYGPLNADAEKIKSLVIEKGVNDLFELKGEISGSAKENAILESDVFVLTSRFEGHPMGLIEALAYGLPAIVTVGSNMKDEIEHTDAGWACETSEESIRNGLLKMIEDRALYKRKSDNAKSLAARYSWDKLAIGLHDQLVKIKKE